MNKTELKNFAIQSRRQLINQVKTKALMYGIDEKSNLEIQEQFGQLMINEKQYPLYMKSAFNSLKNQLKQKGYKQLVEEVAYTWFNRIIAIRYMEVHDYLPETVNVLSSSVGRVDPDILFEYETMGLPVKQEEISELLDAGDTEGAYRKLFIAQCNALSPILPFMFEKIQDYSELLLPDYLLDAESVIKRLVQNEELTKSFEEIEVIGWLYQFYNSEPKDLIFANLKKSKKIERYDVPAATQLFTPKWIVQYMVENSLGQLWLEANPNSSIKDKMKYYIEPDNQEEEEQQKLQEISYKNINIEEITIIDPCVGSGHMLVYAFDLLSEMYDEAGYPSREIPKLILEKNLFGLDIDNRAKQLTSFALIMKAREKTRHIFKQNIILNIYTIKESNNLDKGIAQLLGQTDQEIKELQSLLDVFINGEIFGSLLQPLKSNYRKYLERIDEIGAVQLTGENYLLYDQLNDFVELLEVTEILTSQYDICITNPPYMGSKGMNESLSVFVNEFFPKSKSDLYACFIERLFKLGKESSYISLITPFTWMFLKSYENLRKKIVDTKYISSLIQLEYNAFEAAMVPVCTFVLRNTELDLLGSYIRLADFRGFENQEKMTLEAIKNPKVNYRYQSRTRDFKQLPDSPIAYWASEKTRSAFIENPKLDEIADLKVGLQTGNNDKFLRMWYEVSINKLGFDLKNLEETKQNSKRWLPHNKGGNFRRWYGNQDYIIDWENDGELIKRAKGAVIRNPNFYLKEGLTWSDLTSGKFSARYTPSGFTFNVVAPTLFTDKKYLYLVQGYINSKVFQLFLDYTITGFHYNNGTVSKLPIKIEEHISVNKIVEENILISRNDWNSYEISWGFKKHPLLHFKNKNLQISFIKWQQFSEFQFNQLKANEEELNRIFIDIYGLLDELTPYIEDRDVTICKADLARDVRSFLSYFIGCMVGRYSLDIEGLAYAGEEWADFKYSSFIPNKYGLVQFTDKEYFELDIITRLREFLALAFSTNTVEENMQWLAEALEMKKGEDAKTRLRRYFLDEFFTDHCKIYQKRPIYWLVDSGKQKGLRTLIYMHRYQPDTMATIRFEHLQEIQAKYQNEITDLENRLVNPNLSASEKKKLTVEKTSFERKMDELREFDKSLAEIANKSKEELEIDLDDGVKVNYEKFYRDGKGVLAKIK
ncbi:BREX-1 system adenine-specific DNA-methyltransferase PglX [Niallia taxi]|uniref:BREX-1 system adenine-specific DNA-methyltransferase PglX n=1 Tax=Niallia taxi TaxID=2499688 RepID=UPI0039828EF3